MKKFSILASALLFAGTAYAQAPTNTYTGVAQRAVATPTNTHSANADVAGAPNRGFNSNYTAYSQDSYINQAGSGNYATVDQQDVRTSGIGGGSTAILNQTGDNNNATQKQVSTNTPTSNYYYNGSLAGSRDYMKSTQNGSASQTNQSQTGGVFNSMIITQGAGTTGNRAIQTQALDASGNGIANQATINQTRYGASGGSGNRAEQLQTGILQTARIDQESSNSYAKQTQSSTVINAPNNATIHQGAPGADNTAVQTQNGGNNTARIQQSVGSSANNNYALQNQTLNGNQADITQQSSGNYAEQQQSGLAGGANNYSSISQSNVASAAYSVQSGNNNAAIVVQH